MSNRFYGIRRPKISIANPNFFYPIVPLNLFRLIWLPIRLQFHLLQIYHCLLLHVFAPAFSASSTTSSSSSCPPFTIPLLPFLPSSLPVHSVIPSFLPGFSMVQSVQPSLLPYVGSTEPTISSIFHPASALATPNVTNLVTIKLSSFED